MPIKNWSTTAASNNSSPPNGWPEGQAPSTVNDCARQMMADIRTQCEGMEWFDWGDSGISRASATTFKVTGDVTARYLANRRIKCNDASTLYGLITASSYSNPDTTVTVSLDSGSLTASLTAVGLAILSPTNHSIPSYSPTFSSLTVSGTASVSGAAVFKTTMLVEGNATLSATAIFKTTAVIEGSVLTIKGNSTQSGRVELLEDSDNGTNKVTIAAPAAITSDRTVSLPDRDVILGDLAWEKISTATASSSATIDFTGLSSSYIAYVAVVANALPATDGATLLMRVSSDNGSSYDSGAGNYRYAGELFGQGASPVSIGSGSATSIAISGTLGNSTSEGISFFLDIYNPSSASHYTRVSYRGAHLNATPDFFAFCGAGVRVAQQATNAIRFLMDSGNIASGTFTLYGIRA